MRSLESRFITLSLLFLLVVQIIAFLPLKYAIESQARLTIESELANSERTIQLLLEQQSSKRIDAVTEFTATTEFVNAVNSADPAHIATVLNAKSKQLNADMSLITSSQGRYNDGVDGQHVTAQFKQASRDLIAGAQQPGYASAIWVSGHTLSQLIGVAFKTANATGWLVMALPLDMNFVNQIRKDIPLHVSILVNDKLSWQVLTTSLARADADILARVVPNYINSGIKKIKLNHDEYSLQLVTLEKQTSPDAFIVVQGSITDLVFPYEELQIFVLFMTIVSCIVAIIGSITYTRQISAPLRHLSAIAQRLGTGDYSAAISMGGDKAISDLALAFKHMRDGIAHRENEIKHLAYWDTLTDFPNRVQFTDLLKKTIAATAPQQSCFVLIMDLARFKHVNDIMGHSFGDQILKRIAKRLREAFPDTQLARLGGDEFAMLLPKSTLLAAQKAAQIMLGLLEQPIIVDDQAVDLGAGIGLASYPEHALDAELLLSHAEVAMYAAKKNAGNNFKVYSPEIDGSSQQNLSLLSELRSAIHENQLRLFVQPKLALDTQQIVGVEALMRWEHPARGFLVPDQFIPFAEQTGIIHLLTRWILNKAAELCAELAANDIHLKVSVNISTHDLLDQDLPVKFADILTRHRVKTSAFCLEITESAIMNDRVRAQLTLERLHAMGVEISIDDFGTGYSSLSYLKRLPVDELKIDKSFVVDMEHNDDDRAIVKSTIDLGHNMRLRVVAEGVEDSAVMHLLTAMGCDQVQGNYIHHAIPAGEFIDWLKIRSLN